MLGGDLFHGKTANNAGLCLASSSAIVPMTVRRWKSPSPLPYICIKFVCCRQPTWRTGWLIPSGIRAIFSVTQGKRCACISSRSDNTIVLWQRIIVSQEKKAIRHFWINERSSLNVQPWTVWMIFWRPSAVRQGLPVLQLLGCEDGEHPAFLFE